MVCENCNKEIDEDSKFCLYCGNKVEVHKLEKEIKEFGKIIKTNFLLVYIDKYNTPKCQDNFF